MAGLGRVKGECNRRNRLNRNVNEFHSSLDVTGYWREAGQGNFSITGGIDEQRNQLLIEAIKVFRRTCNGPIIILNGNRDFERQLISCARQNEIGKLIVSSPTYKNYDVFSGMQASKIRELFQEIGRRRGLSDINALGDYIDAFLKILGRKYDLCLNSMLALAQKSDEAIVAFGNAYNVDSWNLDMIKAGTEAGRNFRRLLDDFKDAFQGLRGQEETKNNILSVAADNTVYSIWMRTEFPDILNREIASELQILMARLQRFTLIINDVMVDRNDGLADIIAQAKDISGYKVGICCSDVISWTNGSNERERLLGNTPSLLVVNTGREDSVNQRAMLERFGKYMHFEPTKGMGTTPGMFHLPGDFSENAGMTHFERLRVTMEDMRCYSIAARGHRGDTVELYSGIRGI